MMICHRLLALSLCLQLGWACIPTQPAEDLPCPSVPQASSADGFLLSGLTGPVNMNGAKVYSCADPNYVMLSVDGTTATPLPPGATISCKPNSGIFVLDDGTAVGTKKFNCGQTLVPCPAFLNAPKVDGNDVTPPIMTTEANGDSVWKCEPPSRLYAVENDMSNLAAKKDEGVYVTCKKQSGKLTFSDDPTTTVDPVVNSFACGTLPCQKCDMSIFTDEMNGFCSTQTDIFCNSKPVVSPGADECPSVTCPGGTVLYLMTSATASVSVPNAADIKCDAGAWKNGATDVPMGSFLVCAKAASCDTCNGLIGPVYDEMMATLADVLLTQMRAKPTCTYTCPQNFKMDYLGAPHQSVVCRMDTEVVTLDMEGGTTPSTTNKFGCLKCDCDADNTLRDGAEGLCPMDKLCGAPITANACEAMCPADSTAIYFNSMLMRKTSPTIKCLGMDWIETDYDNMAGVTCQYEDGKVFPDTKPATAACPTLGVLPCPGTSTCDETQIIYYSSGTAIVATCKKGSLLTNFGFGESKIQCNAGSATWSPPVDPQANCVTDESAVAGCKALLDPAVQNVVTYSCTLGTCYFSCPGTQQFEYEINVGMMEKNKNLKCLFGEQVSAISGVPVDDPLAVKCM